MYCMPLFDILRNVLVWSLAMKPSGRFTDIKTIFVFLFFGSWFGTEIASVIAFVLSDCCVILAGRPRLDFMVVVFMSYCVCFM